MDTSLTESSDRLRQALDDEINSWQESTRVLRSRRNALAPISRLSPETLAAVFSYFPPSAWKKEPGYFTPIEGSYYLSRANEGRPLAWIAVSHVCRRWRETALNFPPLWSCINFNNLTSACTAELLTRAKMAPLHLEADATKWSMEQFDTFEKQLEAHISHARHISICVPHHSTLERLVSPAPTLEFLSLLHKSGPYEQVRQVAIPIDFLGYTASSLTSFELEGCDISWKSPILKCLQTLKILKLSTEARPKLEDWLDALDEMPHLKTLILESATPLAPPALLISEPSRTVTLRSLTKFNISASARDCELAFAHLVLPALSWLHVDAKSHEAEGEDMRLLIPYVARIVHGLQNTEPLQSIVISGKRTRTGVLAWSIPDADVKFCDLENNPWECASDASVPACLTFAAKGGDWHDGVNTAILDTLITLLPVDYVSTLTAKCRTGLSKEFWLAHASRWPLLERVRLVPPAVKGFREMLGENTTHNGPRLPSLTKLIIVEVMLNALRTFDLQDMLIERVEQGVPLEALDLSMCYGVDRAIKLLREIVVDVRRPFGERQLVPEDRAFFKFHGGFGYCKGVAYCDDDPWYGCMGNETEFEYFEEFGYDNY